MKKKQVAERFVGTTTTLIYTADSTLGKNSPTAHPARREHISVNGCYPSLRIGDILRCDGLPFAAKPVKTISKIEGSKLKMYDPVRIENGLWVLREIG